MLLTEIDGLEDRGVDTERLLISADAHLLMPYHGRSTRSSSGTRAAEDRHHRPRHRAGLQDKIARIGIRVADLLDPACWPRRSRGTGIKNQMLVKVYNRKALDADEVVENLLDPGRGLQAPHRRHPAPAHAALEKRRDGTAGGRSGHAARRRPRHVSVRDLVESDRGRRGVGSGIGPTRITTVLGILKAYTTRVGAGPFPTELFDEYGEYLSKTGGEFGVTTGRRRRCGWFDAVIARYATRVNGITDYFLTKLDVLSSLETVPVCVGYNVDGKRIDEMPMTQSDIARAEPIYEELPGWWEDISDAREFDDLPAKARDYVLRLEELAGAHVSCIGVGPGRDQTIVRRDVLAAWP